MKKSIIILTAIIMIISSVGIVNAEDLTNTKGNIRLPIGYVTMNAKYGPVSWFDMKLSDVPDCFVIVNGDYLGWCIQQNIFMTQKVNHTVKLYSSYDNEMPESFRNDKWDKINYLINHKVGSRYSIQEAIWYYVENKPYPTDSDAQKMVDDAELNGGGFIPGPGQTIAILVEGIPSIQRTFLELNLPESVPLGDLVWNDLNENGIQENNEPGISDVEVQLYDEYKSIVSSTKTDICGYYLFSGISAGNYYLKFILPEGFKFTKKDQGSNDYLDSDADIATGKTDSFSVNPGIDDISRDAGLVKTIKSGPDPGDANHRPTADGTAGEPYTNIVNSEINFNGSRSYDRDGYIVNWSWDFGDGNIKYGEIVNHIYGTPGLYLVTLKVIDNEGSLDTYETEANVKFENRPPDNPKINGPIFGHKNIFYTYSTVANDPDNDKVMYTVNWDDSITSDSISEFITSGIPYSAANSWSEPGKYTITVYASDSKLSSSSELIVYIDRVDVEDLGYIIDEDSDGIFETFYYSHGSCITKIKHIGLNLYLIDVNCDGEWDYEFNSDTGELNEYSPGLVDYNFLLILLALLAIIFLIIIYYVYKKRK